MIINLSQDLRFCCCCHVRSFVLLHKFFLFSVICGLFLKKWASFSFIFVFSNKHYILKTNKWEISIQYTVLGFKPTTFGTWVSSYNPLDQGSRPICSLFLVKAFCFIKQKLLETIKLASGNRKYQDLSVKSLSVYLLG